MTARLRFCRWLPRFADFTLLDPQQQPAIRVNIEPKMRRRDDGRSIAGEFTRGMNGEPDRIMLADRLAESIGMNSAIHEVAHRSFPDATEREVATFSATATAILVALGFRFDVDAVGRSLTADEQEALASSIHD